MLWAFLAIPIAMGCRTQPPRPVPAFNPPPPIPALELNVVAPASSLEPDYKTLPTIDPVAATVVEVVPLPTGYRSLTEDVCQREAAVRASVANLLRPEDQIPMNEPCGCPTPGNTLIPDLRFHLTAEARNRAATSALEQFFQLADAEGRGEIVRLSLPILDQLRTTVRKGKAEGLRVPVDSEELDRQRVGLLSLLSQAEVGARLLDIDLKRRVGVDGHTAERLRPSGTFAVSSEVVDPEAAVSIALENRADLRFLRTAYLKVTADNLPTVRDLVRNSGGLHTIPVHPPIRPEAKRNAYPDPILVAELAVRRHQLLMLITERERQVADEVRAAVTTLMGQTQQVALTRWRADQTLKQAKTTNGKGPLVELPAELEALRARADVIAAVMNWHQARVKLAGAQGLNAPPAENPNSPRN